MNILPDKRRRQAASLALRREEIQGSLALWAKHIGFTPAPHHAKIIEALEAVVDRQIQNLIVCCPPGSAKSTYISRLFPPWYLLRQGRKILACSYSFDLIQGWSRQCRNDIEAEKRTLNYGLAADQKSVKAWATTKGGLYFCAGTGAGIAGHRASLGVIDDPIGAEDEADSLTYRDKLWAWWWNDFLPRITEGEKAKVIIANRRHEDDLVGRLLTKEPKKWHTLIIPFFPVGEDDVMGRKPVSLSVDTSILGDPSKTEEEITQDPALRPLIESRLWPEYYDEGKAVEVLQSPPRTRAGLYQQAPAAEEGNFFRKEMFLPYTVDQLPKDLNIYVASDHAVSEEQVQNGDLSCLLPVGVDTEGVIWVLPDVWWKKAETTEVVSGMLDLIKRRKPIIWWGESENIFKSIYPFLRQRMVEQSIFCHIEKVVPSKRKLTRAQAIQGRCSMGRVRVPTFTHWWNLAEAELLMFPNGKHDDFCDAFAYIGLGLDKMANQVRQAKPAKRHGHMTLGWLKDVTARVAKDKQLQTDDV